jgi:hypothetical protein
MTRKIREVTHRDGSIINLCKHPINLRIQWSSKVETINIPPSGAWARVVFESKPEMLHIEGMKVPVYNHTELKTRVLGIPKVGDFLFGLPHEKKGVYYIVSRVVADNNRDRGDLLCPNVNTEKDGTKTATGFFKLGKI